MEFLFDVLGGLADAVRVAIWPSESSHHYATTPFAAFVYALIGCGVGAMLGFGLPGALHDSFLGGVAGIVAAPGAALLLCGLRLGPFRWGAAIHGAAFTFGLMLTRYVCVLYSSPAS